MIVKIVNEVNCRVNREMDEWIDESELVSRIELCKWIGTNRGE